MKKLLITLMLTAMAPAAFAVTTLKAEVNGMVCAFCAKGIEKKLKSLPEGQAAFVDLKSRVVAFQLKDGQTLTDETFNKVIQDAGYSVGKVERVSQTVAEIQSQLGKSGKEGSK